MSNAAQNVVEQGSLATNGIERDSRIVRAEEKAGLFSFLYKEKRSLLVSGHSFLLALSPPIFPFMGASVKGETEIYFYSGRERDRETCSFPSEVPLQNSFSCLERKGG